MSNLEKKLKKIAEENDSSKVNGIERILGLIEKALEELEGEKFSELFDLLNTIKLRVYNKMTDEEDKQFDIDLDYHEYNCDRDDYDPDDVSEVEAEITVTDLTTNKNDVIDGIIINYDYDNDEYSL